VLRYVIHWGLCPGLPVCIDCVSLVYWLSQADSTLASFCLPTSFYLFIVRWSILTGGSLTDPTSKSSEVTSKTGFCELKTVVILHCRTW